jgi:hypothetical protein
VVVCVGCFCLRDSLLGGDAMKYLMGFLFALIPALVVGAITYPFCGPFSLLLGWAVWGLGMDVCFNGR